MCVSKQIIFYLPSFSLGAYEDEYEVSGPAYVSLSEAKTWFDPAVNPEWVEAFSGDYEYGRSPSGYRVVRWELELPTVGHASTPLVEEVWNENENPYTGKKAF
jgi:hypothetical protein